MRRHAVLAALLSMHAAQATPAPTPTPTPGDVVLGDLCAPAGWAPATHVYRLRSGATLVFVAVEHGTNPASRTMAQIRAAFDRYRPGVVLIEGASSARSADPAYLAFLADTARQGYAAGRVGENLYAVKLAADAHVPYAAWDMSPHDDYVGDIAAGFDMADAVGAHLLRGHLDPFGPPAPSLLQAELAAVPHVRQPAAFDYPGWYRRTYGDVFLPAAGTPCGTGVASRIVRFESKRRTRNLAQVIAARAGPGAVVMVEAGAAHWSALRDYLASISVALPVDTAA